MPNTMARTSTSKTGAKRVAMGDDSDDEESRFAVPAGFVPIGNEDMHLEASPFHYQNLRAKPNQQLWLIRAPKDFDPATLNDITLKQPTPGSSQPTLGRVQIGSGVMSVHEIREMASSAQEDELAHLHVFCADNKTKTCRKAKPLTKVLSITRTVDMADAPEIDPLKAREALDAETLIGAQQVHDAETRVTKQPPAAASKAKQEDESPKKSKRKREKHEEGKKSKKEKKSKKT